MRRPAGSSAAVECNRACVERTGVELRAAEVFPTASSIKTAVLYELYRQAEEGKIDLGEVTRPRPCPGWGAAASSKPWGPR